MNNNKNAGFWIRFGAFFIDLLLFWIITGVPLWLIYGDAYFSGNQLFAGFWDVILVWIFPMVATIWFWVRHSATPGKMACKLKIVDATSGQRISIKQGLIRYLGYFPSTWILGLGYIWMLFDQRKQTWHDKLAGTVVVMGES